MMNPKNNQIFSPQVSYRLRLLGLSPLLPLLIWQGKKLRKSFPPFKEAKDIRGSVGSYDSGALRLLIIGESTMAGVGAISHAKGFAGQLAGCLAQCTRKNVHWEVCAKSGMRMDKLASFLDKKNWQKDIDLLVIGMGANDSFALTSPQKWILDLSKLVTYIHKHTRPTLPIAIGHLPPTQDFPLLTNLMQNTIGKHTQLLERATRQWIASQKNIFYPPQNGNLTQWISRYKQIAPKEAFFSDGIHPSELGYQIWAQDLCVQMQESGFLDPLLASPS